jgi:hypothetical protein
MDGCLRWAATDIWTRIHMVVASTRDRSTKRTIEPIKQLIKQVLHTLTAALTSTYSLALTSTYTLSPQTATTFFAFLTLHSSGRLVLFRVLFFPALIPVLFLFENLEWLDSLFILDTSTFSLCSLFLLQEMIFNSCFYLYPGLTCMHVCRKEIPCFSNKSQI